MHANPYEPPRAPPPAPEAVTAIARGRGRVAQVAVLAVVGLRLVAAAALVATRQGLSDFDLAVKVDSLRKFAFWIATVFFFVWLHRAVKNLGALGRADFPFSPGMAIGWWFVPVANVVQAPRIMDALFRASGGDDLTHRWRHWRQNRSTPLVAVWWAAHLVSGFAAVVHWEPVATWLVATTLTTIGGLSLVALVGGIDRGQAALAARVGRIV
jgi:hypothetical protein